MHNVLMTQKILHEEHKSAQFCVVGGGMAGFCAAVAAARNGIRTLLLQDRPVLGGNASSEVRMTVCGARGKEAKEGGILEEALLKNLAYNPQLKYTIWDDILYGICREEPLLEVIFNCSVNEVHHQDRRIQSIKAWHLTRQCWIHVEAQFFADCSGDSILRTCGAEVRWGRESRREFNESHAPLEADDKTMGNSIMIQVKETDEHHPFRAPSWAKKLNEKDIENRGLYPGVHNFWWLEYGGMMNTINDSDKIRDENLAIAYGAWDLIKNHPDGRAHHWELEWIGSLPGKRENVRYVGDVIITQNDIESGGHFDDIVCHGGWPMDDHHPEAIHYKGEPTIFHPAPSPYGIPFRALYSKSMDNLFCAGRNISATHMAMSSTRVMGTTSVMGQAIGTAVAIAIELGLTSTREIYSKVIPQLQARLREQDQYIPWTKRPTLALTCGGVLTSDGDDPSLLMDGIERDLLNDPHGWWGKSGQSLTWTFPCPQQIKSVRIIGDSDFENVKHQPYKYPRQAKKVNMPQFLLKTATLQALNDNGQWSDAVQIEDNLQRLIKIPCWIQTKGLRLVIKEAWGGSSIPTHLFSFDLETSPAT